LLPGDEAFTALRHTRPSGKLPFTKSAITPCAGAVFLAARTSAMVGWLFVFMISEPSIGTPKLAQALRQVELASLRKVETAPMTEGLGNRWDLRIP
jgi:hypothetical protein